MTKDKNTDKSIASPAETQPQAPAAEQKKLSRTKGEKLFDWLVYGGIAGVAQYIAAIGITYWARHNTKNQVFTKGIEFFKKRGASQQAAEQAAMTTALMMGGNLAIIPIKMLEDNKPALVQSLNEKVDPTHAEEPLHDNKKQTWTSLIGGRVAAWLAVMTGFRGVSLLAGADKLEKFEHAVAKNVLCEPFGVPTHIAGKETALYKIGRIGALDAFATAAATIILYFGSKLIASKRDEKELSNIVAKTVPALAVEAVIEKDLEEDAAPKKSYASTVSKTIKPVLAKTSHAASVQNTEPLAAHSLQ